MARRPVTTVLVEARSADEERAAEQAREAWWRSLTEGEQAEFLAAWS